MTGCFLMFLLAGFPLLPAHIYSKAYGVLVFFLIIYVFDARNCLTLGFKNIGSCTGKCIGLYCSYMSLGYDYLHLNTWQAYNKSSFVLFVVRRFIRKGIPSEHRTLVSEDCEMWKWHAPFYFGLPEYFPWKNFINGLYGKVLFIHV